MKRAKTFSRTVRTGDRKSFAGRSIHVRRRTAGLKLEALEQRTLLSTTTKVVPGPALDPQGLGVSYTAMSEQAHGVGLHTSSPGQYQGSTTNTTTMEELTAYLKNLGSAIASANSHGQTLQSTTQNTSGTLTGTPSPTVPTSVTNSGSGDDGGDEDSGSPGTNFPNDPARVSPINTGLATPPLLPTVVSGFNGMNFVDSVNGYVPPDTDIAVGPQYVVETVNAQIQIYNKTTGAALLPNTPLSTFFTASGGDSPFDPVVTYDDIANRFIVAAPTFQNNLLLAVSKDSNPLDGFTLANYKLNVSEGGLYSGDYPKIGWNHDEVVITLNMDNSSGFFDHVQVLSFAASSLFAASPPTTLTQGTNYFSADQYNDFTMAAASMHGSNAGDPMLFVEENGFDNGSSIRVVTATNLLSNSPTFNDTNIAVDSYEYPPSAQQPGGSPIQTDDTGILNADYRNGVLVADQNVGLSTDSDAHARWYEFSVVGTPTLVQDGTISPAAGTSTFYPAIAIGAGGIIGMTYNESSASEYPSVYVTGRNSSDPTGTMESSVLAKAGTATYSDFAANRWGDYSGISVDPSAPGTFWSGAEYSTSTLSGMPANWATWISHFEIAPSVVSSNPAANSVVVSASAPTVFSLKFDRPIDPASITAGNFKVNNIGANSASLSGDGLTITYTFTTTPVTQQGSESMSLAAGSVKGAGDETGNAAFSASFFYTTLQLQVTATSPAVGSILTVPVTDLVVQFNKAFNPLTVSTSDFQLSQGTVASVKELTSQAVDLTLSGITQDGTMTLTVPAGAILDTNGVPNAAFTGSYIIQVNSQPFPTTFQSAPPPGSLIYDPSATGGINFAGDTDNYTLPLAANQTLTLVMTTDPGLTGTITLYNPGGVQIGTATAAGAGKTVVLQTAPAATAGTYTIAVSGSGTGNYTVQAILNAVYKQATASINTIGTADDLSSAFTSLGTTPAADRAGVLGTIDAAADPDLYKFFLNAGQSATLADQGLNGLVSLGLLDGNGNLLALPNGATLAGPLNFGSGFTGASSQLTVNGNTFLSGSNLELTDGGFGEAGSAFSNTPVYIGNFSTSFNFQITPGTNPTADGFTFTMQGVGPNALGFGGGDLGYGTIGSSVAIKFDLYNNAGEGTDSTGIYTNGEDPYVPAIDLTGTGIDLHSGDVFNVAMKYDGSTLNVTITDTITKASASQSYSVNIPSFVGGEGAYVGFTGGTGGLSAVQNIQNWTFTPAQNVISSATFEAIDNFVAPTSGWYYAEVNGNPGTNYSLVVTRGADFDHVPNQSIAQAQPLQGGPVALGFAGTTNVLATGGANAHVLFYVDLEIATNTFAEAFANLGITPTVATSYSNFESELSSGSWDLVVLMDQGFLDTTWEAPLINYVNQGGHAIVASWAEPQDVAASFGATYTGNTNLQPITQTVTSPIWSGISNPFNLSNPGWGTWSTGLQATTGQAIGTFPNGDGGIVVGNSGHTILNGFLQDTPANAAQGVELAENEIRATLITTDKDFYSVQVRKGENLIINTTTPGGTSASGLQFPNALYPAIDLYDPSGNLVASAAGNAGDGRNSTLTYTALATGTYYVRVSGANGTSGEYTVSITGAAGSQPPFVVTATNPTAGADLGYQVSTMTVSVSDSINISSISASDFTIDGNNATGETVLDSHDVIFTFPTTADGVHNVSISGLADIHGLALTPDTFTFKTDDVPPVVVSSSIANGAVLSPGNLTEVVTFSKPIDPASVGAFDVLLQGLVRGVSYSPSLSFDPTGTILTLNYSNLPSDAYQFTLLAGPGNFTSLADVPLESSFVINFTMPLGTTALSGLQPVLPLGGLVYQGTSDQVLVSTSDVDTFNLTIDPNQTIAVLVTPVTSSMTVTVNLFNPNGVMVGTATSAAPGQPALIPAVQAPGGGAYKIQVSGGPGEYKIQATLNALIDPAAHGGASDGTIATAQPLGPYANPFAGQDDRVAVLGAIQGVSVSSGDAFVAARGANAIEAISHTTGQVIETIPVSGGTLSGVELGPDGNLYAAITTSFNAFSVSGELLKFDLSGDLLATITLPDDPVENFLYYPFGFGIAPDNSFWIPQPNSANIIHVDANGNELASYFIGGNPEAASVRSDGQILISLSGNGELVLLNPSTGSVSFFASSPAPEFSDTAPTGGSWVGDFDTGGLRFDNNGNVVQNVGGFGTVQNQNDPSGNVWNDNFAFGQVYYYNTTGNIVFGTAVSSPIGLTVVGVDSPPPPPPTVSVYSFSLNQGQSASLALESQNGKDVHFSIEDSQGHVLALSNPGASNYTAGLNNFVAQANGTYYVVVAGQGGAKFNLVVTRGADFTTQPHTTLTTAQNITATQQSGNSQQGGVLGYLQNPSGAFVGTTIEGIDFNGSSCGCLPPDTNAAVSPNFVAETVNVQFRVWDKSGNVLLDEPLDTLFGGANGGDPYVEYDDIANRWYVTAIDDVTVGDEWLAVSNDANPLHGFSHVYEVPLAAPGDIPDFTKFGYNADAIVMEAQDYSSSTGAFLQTVVTAVSKAPALSGTLTYYQSVPPAEFRALTPAQMHGAAPGAPMWFISTDGYTFPASTIRVTEMTNLLSTTPTYTTFSLAVNTFGYTTLADQPGAPGSVETNDPTTTSVDFLDGKMVTALAATDASDGFTQTHVHWYEVDVSSGTPTLVQEGLINPGPGVATYFGAAAIDPAGNIGLSYMESSSTEYVSAYVAGHIASQPLGTTTAGTAFAPGGGPMPDSFREGDYGSAVYDPSTGQFWGANEYIGSDGSTDIWRTKIASFTVFSASGTDFYSVNANAGDKLQFTTTTPAGGPNEFSNTFDPQLVLYAPNGKVVAVATGNAADGRNSVIDYTVPAGGAGTYTIEVTPSPLTANPTQGEYGLLVTGATGAVPSIVVTSTIPANGALIQPPTDYIVTFSQSVYAPSLTPGELTINGVSATAVTLVDAHTVDWTINPSSFSTGDRVLNTAVISADPGTGQRVEDVSGASLANFTSTFTTDNVPPSVISSSVANGAVFSPAPYSLTEVVTFSEPMNTAFTTASSFELFGNFRNQSIAAASFTWNAAGTRLTINYANLPDDTYTLTLFAAGFQDLVGLPMASNYTVNFAVALGTAALPTPFTAIPPLGDLIYTDSDTHVLVTPTDVDKLTANLNPGQTLSVVVTPTTSALQPVITVFDPSNHKIATATAPGQGQAAVIETTALSVGGVYTIQVSDAGGNLGLYTIQDYLNAYVKTGTSNISIATAQDLSSSSISLGTGTADRLAVVGSLPTVPLPGDAYVSSRYYGDYFGGTISDILRVNGAGQVAQIIPVPQDTLGSLSGVELSPYNNELYAAVTTSFNSGSVSGELLEFDSTTGKLINTITLPNDLANNGLYYPYGFSAAADGTFWVPQPNSDNIIHIDASGNELASFSTGATTPESATINPGGNVYFSGYNSTIGNGVYLLNTKTRAVSLFAIEPSPDMTKIAATGGFWVGDYDNGAQRFDNSGNLLQSVGYFGSIQAQTDPSGNIWTSNFNYFDLFRFDPSGNQQLATFAPGALGTTVWGVDNPNAPPPDTQDYYSFSLAAGQSATIVVESLNGEAVQITLQDKSGNVLATGVGGSTNVSQSIQNFVAPTAGTYYLEVTGDQGVKYSLAVTRSANFDIEPHNTAATAQSLTGTNGVLGALDPGGTLTVGTSFEGASFSDPNNNCGCLPPDTNASVGGNYIVETVNTEIVVYNKSNGSILLDEPLSTLFGAASGGDVYVVYDDIANRWYVSAFDSSDTGLFLAVSKDGNPLDGFLPTYDLTGIGGAPDYPKPGFNKDAIFISYNDFSSSGLGNAAIASINKAAALSGTLTYFVSHPEAQFRAMPPAQMHGDTTGGIEWFFSTDGNDVSGDTMRVTEMTNYLSSSPTFTYTSIPVAPYQAPVEAVQPGGTWTTFPNTTTYEVQYRNGILVTAMASGTAADGFTYPKGLYYEVNVSSGTPVLVKQGVIDPGPGVSVQMPSVDIDSRGDLGFTWMEASSTEYVSMWVGSLDTLGHFSSYDAAPGGGFFYENFRIGDYSTTVLDPTNGTTFWSANEYIGSDGATNIWRTHITSFSVPPAVNNDWYTINVAAGNSLVLQSYTPSDQGGEFENTHVSVNIEVFDTFGNLVATGTKLADGINESLTYKAPQSGQYHILVFNSPGTYGEYFLSVNTAQYASGSITGEVYNDLNGNGVLNTGDPGLNNWVVQVYNSKSVLVASELTYAGGTFDFEGLTPGSYTVKEVLQSGWVQTAPPAPGTFSVTVTAGGTVSGRNFGNFQSITITGDAFNDLNGDGSQEAGEPGLANWQIQLLNSAGKVIANTKTDANGNYSFANLGPGNYTVTETLQSGWTLTAPAAPGMFTVAATSGQNVSGLAFGDFQLLTYSGTVYNDLNGNGVMDKGENSLKGWTLNLFNMMGNLVASQTTGGNGTYSFGNLGPGIWTISEVQQTGWYQTQPGPPSYSYSIVASSGSNQSGLNYGDFQLVTFTGNVYNDVNGDGKQQGSEPGLPMWTVDLLNSSGNVAAVAVTDSKGNYSFNGVFPGTFTVAQVIQSGWVQTQPLYPTVYTVTTQSGQNVSGLVFGDHSAPALTPTATLDYGQSGYAETGTVSTVQGGFDGTNRTAKTTGGNTATATASWTFGSLAAGKYDVWITYFGAGNYSSKAPFTVFDGSTILGTTSINESILVTQSQGGLSQGSYGGVGWLDLGTFTVNSGTLKVLLTNLTNGGYVDADGVLYIADGAAPSVALGAAPATFATASNNAVSMGVVDTNSTSVANGSESSASNGPTTAASSTALPTVSVTGVRQTSPVHVVYNQGGPPTSAQPTSGLIDIVLGLGETITTTRNTKSADPIASLARDLVAGGTNAKA